MLGSFFRKAKLEPIAELRACLKFHCLALAMIDGCPFHPTTPRMQPQKRSIEISAQMTQLQNVIDNQRV